MWLLSLLLGLTGYYSWGPLFSYQGENLVLGTAWSRLRGEGGNFPRRWKNQCLGPDPGRCQSHAKAEAKQKVGVKVRAWAAGGCAPSPCGRGAGGGRVWPGAPGPSGSRRWDVLPSRRAVYFGPARRTESTLGGAAGRFPARKL